MPRVESRFQKILFQVVEILSQVLADLVQGEFMQLQTKQDEEDRFNQKTRTKTATNTTTKIKTITNTNVQPLNLH